MSIVDPRIIKQSRILVDDCLKLKKGENVVIMATFEAKPLDLELYKYLLLKGAGEIKIHFSDYEFDEAYFKNASDWQLKLYPKHADWEMRHIDCYIRIDSKTNTKGLTAIDSNKIALRAKVTQPILDYRVEKTKWVVTKYPTHALAQEADMSLEDYSDFVFDAICDTDWKKVYRGQERLRKLVDKTDNVRIVGKDTDLMFSIKGRKAVNSAADHNMPSGEVFTSVVESTPSGYITFSYPAIYSGKEFLNVRLEFRNGKVIKASADKNSADLNAILDTDHGARFIGEFGIGNNFQIKRFTKDILFDEKIGGSIHLALGKSYKDNLGKNVSAIHWDMIKDLIHGGEIWFDGKLVQKNGKWEF